MLIIYEYAACVLAVSVGATLLFVACVTVLALKEGGCVLRQEWRKFRQNAIQQQVKSLAAERLAVLGQGSPL
jgi:glucose-6-phosphate dehydrogenase assembly protein OpcA